MPVDPHRLHLLGMHHLTHASVKALQHQQRPAALKSAAGASRAGPYHHQAQQNGLGKSRPQVKVRGGIAGGGHNGSNLERRVPNRLPQRLIVALQVQGNQDNAARHHTQVQPQLLVPKHIFKLPDQQQIVTAEIHTKQQHKHRTHILYIWAVARNAVVFYTETARPSRSEGGADRLKQGHSPRQQKNNIHHGQQNV